MSISSKVNRIEWFEFELSYLKDTVQHFSHQATRAPLFVSVLFCFCFCSFSHSFTFLFPFPPFSLPFPFLRSSLTPSIPYFSFMVSSYSPYLSLSLSFSLSLSLSLSTFLAFRISPILPSLLIFFPTFPQPSLLSHVFLFFISYYLFFFSYSVSSFLALMLRTFLSSSIFSFLTSNLPSFLSSLLPPFLPLPILFFLFKKIFVYNLFWSSFFAFCFSVS